MFDEVENRVKFRNVHRSRGQWIKYLGLRSMNNIGRTPTCGVHYTYKICLLDSISLTGIADWIGNPINTTKERKRNGQQKNSKENR